MSVLRISKISFVRELFRRGVSILCGEVASSSSTFRTFALLWVGRGFKAKAAYFLLSWTCCVHGHDHAPYSILHVSSTGLEWVTTPYHLATSITTNTTSVWCCCLFLSLFAVLNGCWTTDGRTERQTRWTFRTDIPICNRANVWGVTKHSELDVQCWGLSTCPLWSLDTVFFYRKSRRFLVFFR